MAKLLKANEEQEPELLRWGIIGYAQKVLLNNETKNEVISSRAYLIIQNFCDNFYDSKYAGLVAACYSVING